MMLSGVHGVVLGQVTVRSARITAGTGGSVDQSVVRATTSEITGAGLPVFHSKRTVSALMPCAGRRVYGPDSAPMVRHTSPS